MFEGIYSFYLFTLAGSFVNTRLIKKLLKLKKKLFIELLQFVQFERFQDYQIGLFWFEMFKLEGF